jgi:hypothetical protein
MNIRLLYLAVALLFATSVSAQSMTSSSSSAGSTEQQPCTVSGMVVKLDGSEPLRKAKLTLRSADDRTRSVTIATNSDGVCYGPSPTLDDGFLCPKVRPQTSKSPSVPAARVFKERCQTQTACPRLA